MNEQTRISTGQLEQGKAEAPVAIGAGKKAKPTGKGSASQMAGFKARESYVMPDPIVGATWIPLNKDLFALVDSIDAPMVEAWCWSTKKSDRSYYASRKQSFNGRKRTIYLHRFILNAPADMEVDHINGNGWDCRRKNLRLCTQSQNSLNTNKPNRPTSSAFKGVSWCNTRNKWRSGIRLNGRDIALGRFHSELDAALAYNAAATELFGEFAKLNVIPPC